MLKFQLNYGILTPIIDWWVVIFGAVDDFSQLLVFLECVGNNKFETCCLVL